ncbi:SIMPL domain-containing protein [candidate division KSB1 bacterium]|nr:SIMPL domain-containing protein [candidate division KSB1 bacterium]
MERSTNTIGLVAIAVAIALFGLLAQRGFVASKRTADVVTVTGSAKKAIVSDYVTWRASVRSQRATLKEAYEDVEKYQARIRDYLKANKVPDESVRFSTINTGTIDERNDNYQETGRILAYTCHLSFEIQSDKVKEVTDLSSRASELIKEDIPLDSNSPEYIYTKLSDLRIEMLGEASRDARARAEKIAESAGVKIGALRTARMGVFQVTPRNSTDVSDYGTYDTSSLEKDITSVVSLSFAVE